MKTITPAMREHLNQFTTSLAACWMITRSDGKVFTFTDHDQDLVIEGVTYEAQGSFTRTAVQSSADMSVDNLDVSGYFSGSGIFEDELRAGMFDHAAIQLFLVNWQDLTMGTIPLRRGTIGQVVLTKQGRYTAELRGMFQQLSQNIGQVYSYNCRADLGDSKCRVPLLPSPAARSTAVLVGQTCRAWATQGQGTTNYPVDANGAQDSSQYMDKMFTAITAGTTGAAFPAWTFNDGDIIVDGTVQWQCGEAWARSVTVNAPDPTGRAATSVNWTNGRDPRSVGLDDYYAGGMIQWETGSNYPGAMEIRQDSAETNVIDLYLSVPFVMQPGDRGVITPGCNRTPQMCTGRYDNILNYRGEPFLPGIDFMVNTPGASGG